MDSELTKNKSLLDRLSPDVDGDGIIVLSRNFDIMSCNNIIEQFLERSLIPASHLPLDQLFASSDLPKALEVASHVLNQGKHFKKIKARLVQKNKEQCLYEYSAAPVFKETQNIIGIIYNFRHTSTPLPTLKISKYMPSIDFQVLFENLPEGFFTINTSWRITSFNRTAEKITGYRKLDVIGRHCWDIFRTEQCQKNCPMGISLTTGITCMDHEITIINYEGNHQSILVNSSAICCSEGSILGAIETFRVPKLNEVIPTSKHKKCSFGGIIGKSKVMQSIFSTLPDIAASDTSVLICGESGTGKDLIARFIHNNSKNSKGPFVSVNCMALTESLLESELFGHEKGAFTGATRTRQGRFEMASGGTFFLNEIGELKMELQVKLLNVLEQKTFERVGGTCSIPLNARIISATNKDLDKALREGRFREDLYYRLKTVPVNLPPLRERKEDIPTLIDYFIQKFNKKFNKNVRSVDPKVTHLLMNYNWPGNIRELERFMEHAFVFVKSQVIFARYLPDIHELRVSQQPASLLPSNRKNPTDKENIIWALSQSRGRRKEAADLLGISRTSLWRKMKFFGLP